MAVNKDILKRLPTVPQYYKQYIDTHVDLEETPYQPCPFHGETNGRSFSYSRQLGIWQCFGACHTGGDVIKLHMKNYKLRSYEEAQKSLCQMYGITLESIPVFEEQPPPEVDKADVHRRRVLSAAIQLAKNPDDYLELDYIVSKIPYDVKELEVFCSARGFNILDYCLED